MRLLTYLQTLLHSLPSRRAKEAEARALELQGRNHELVRELNDLREQLKQAQESERQAYRAVMVRHGYGFAGMEAPAQEPIQQMQEESVIDYMRRKHEATEETRAQIEKYLWPQ